MPEFTAVSRERHAGKAWCHQTSYAFAAGDAVLPLTASELVQAVIGHAGHNEAFFTAEGVLGDTLK